jgi:hypothetical protein
MLGAKRPIPRGAREVVAAKARGARLRRCEASARDRRAYPKKENSITNKNE